MLEDLQVEIIDPAADPLLRAKIGALLSRCGLSYEEGIEAFIVCQANRRTVGCAGLQGNIIKCVAIDPDRRGESLSLKLMGEVLNLAQDRGFTHLFLYTRPENARLFENCGFYPLVEVSDEITLMENTPAGIHVYCRKLATLRKPGAVIGAAVMNANPFTFGHHTLVQEAAKECDWLHVFVVAEDTSLISYRDRYGMVAAGIRGIDRVTLHHGSQYSISRATFPSYFFKEKGLVGPCRTAIDLLLFRNFIAPALGITHRYVGSEPYCPVTRKYNADMKFWLYDAPTGTPVVRPIEIPRTALDDIPISASEVRRLLKVGDLERIAQLVPPTTLRILSEKYAVAGTADGNGGSQK
jgi:[citrate (pro-3S)-lyase] ligase